MSDVIFVNGLLVHGHHGVMAHEEKVGQRFVIDLELAIDLAPAGRSDKLADTASYSDIVFGLFAICGYQFSPRIADLSDTRLWRIDPDARYGPLDAVGRHRIRLTRVEPVAHTQSHPHSVPAG